MFLVCNNGAEERRNRYGFRGLYTSNCPSTGAVVAEAISCGRNFVKARKQTTTIRWFLDRHPVTFLKFSLETVHRRLCHSLACQSKLVNSASNPLHRIAHRISGCLCFQRAAQQHPPAFWYSANPPCREARIAAAIGP
jgi:hypothetical protein